MAKASNLNVLHVIPTLFEILTEAILITSSMANSLADHLEASPRSNLIVTTYI
jgi:hypothetical protein